MKTKYFSDYNSDASNWITLAGGEYYPDILKDACASYKPVLVLFGQLVKSSESSSGLQMDTVMKVKNLYDSVNAQDDPRMNLLSAIRPYMRSGRATKLDSALKILQVTKIGSAMKGFGKF